MDKRILPLGLTLDVEPNLPSIVRETGRRYSGLTEVIPRLVDLFNKLETPATWFITHDDWMRVDEQFPELVETLHENGEIGCHVHFSRGRRLSSAYEFQFETIERATRALRDRGFSVKSFRGGANYLDEGTLRVLETLDYEIDSSVVPAMYKKHCTGFVVDHRRCTSSRPYFPSSEDHCNPGDSKILELPIFADPIVNVKGHFFRVFIGRTLPMNVPSEKAVDDILRRIGKNGGSSSGELMYPIILSAHPYDFLYGSERKLANISRLISQMKRKFDARFLTLGDIRNQWTDLQGEFQNGMSIPEMIVSGGNSINFCLGRRLALSLSRKSSASADDIE